jgi:hypothetical protein
MYPDVAAKCPMHLTLHFSNGVIRGAGIDNPGQFVIDGVYDDVNQQVSWSKRYVRQNSVRYQGTYSNSEITGVWSLDKTKNGRRLQGQFRIWPLPGDAYGENESLKSILEKEIQRKG